MLSPQAQRHQQRRRDILAAHPEVAALQGPQPNTVVALIALWAVHWSVTAWVATTNVGIVFVMAFIVGQLCLHAVGTLIHESAHRLIVRGRAKLAVDLGLEVVMTSFGKQLTYQHEHMSSHHPHLGDYEHDYEHEDLCRYAARRTLRATRPRLQRLLTIAELALHALPLGFLVSDALLMPLYRRAAGASVRDRQRHIGASRARKAEHVLFVAVSIASLATLAFAFGPLGVLYQVWSLSLFLGKLGVTNLGQSLSEHPGDDEENPSRSSYSWLNRLLFNTGYHCEHHTFPTIAWTNLPKLKAVAPEAFDVADSHSYFGRWWLHVRADFSPSRKSPLHDTDLSARCSPPIRS